MYSYSLHGKNTIFVYNFLTRVVLERHINKGLGVWEDATSLHGVQQGPSTVNGAEEGKGHTGS